MESKYTNQTLSPIPLLKEDRIEKVHGASKEGTSHAEVDENLPVNDVNGINGINDIMFIMCIMMTMNRLE